MFRCEAAVELLKELQRDNWIPPYNAASIRQIAAETSELWTDLSNTVQQIQGNLTPEEHQQMIVQYSIVERNKRCVLTYLKHRVEESLKIRMDCGTSVIPDNLKDRLCQSELKSIKDYDRMLTRLFRAQTDDLTEYLEPPSCRANHLLIRVQEDYGEGTALSNLSVNLLQHSTHNVPRRDVEHLVRQGYLECEVVGDPHCSGRGQ